MAGQNNWEFLLQQEGDRSWLPLESPDVEILEGRYRVLVRTAATNTTIALQITHEATEETPPRRRTQTRSGRTSPDGLMVVIPFTLLQPGIWEMTCTPNDLSSDLLGYQGQYSIQLHVLPKETDLAGEWEPDWTHPATPAIPTPPTVRASHPSPPTLSSPPPLPVLAEEPPLAPPSSPVERIPTPDRPQSLAPLQPSDPIRFTLTSSTYDIQPGQTLILSGQLTADRPGQLTDCTFTTEILDPQSGQSILTTPITITTLDLPYDLQLGVVLPSDLTGQLFLGRITLTQAANPQEILTEQAFTLLAAIDTLLLSLPTELKPTTRPVTTDDLPTPPPQDPGPEFDDEFLGMINQGPTATEFRPASPASPLPPQLYQPDTGNTENRPPRPPIALPTFLQTPAPETNLNALFDDDWDDTSEPIDSDRSPFDLPDDVPLDDVPLVDEDTLLAEIPALEDSPAQSPDRISADTDHPALENLSDDLDDLLPQDLYNTTAPLDLDDPDDLKTIDIRAERLPDAFESLNLGDRFMDRINTLAETTQADAAQAIPPSPPQPLNPFVTSRPPVAETVVLDEPLFTSMPADLSDIPLTLPDDTPIPTPRLEIEATHEVIAGQSLTLKIKLPNLQPKLYVKLWINDRATRTLLDGPRYLIDFLTSLDPNTLEATTTLTVPLGSLEIQIEAITIETATKRESYKATAPLTVIPPDLPDFSLDNFRF